MTAAPPPPINYVGRWRDAVAARRAQHEAAEARRPQPPGDYWARRAADYHRFVHESRHEGEDPFVTFLRARVSSTDTLLDVGAGTGRHALPLARDVRRVIALDPSAAMLDFLRRDAEAEGLTNVETVEGAWPEAASRAGSADVVISAHVLYPIEDVEPFLRAIDAAATRLCAVNMMLGQPWFDRLGVWDVLHGERRLPQPVAIDALNVLHQLGCFASLEVAAVESRRAFATVDEGVDRLAEFAGGITNEERPKVREVLERRLERQPDGSYVLGMGRTPLGMISWRAGELQAGDGAG